MIVINYNKGTSHQLVEKGGVSLSSKKTNTSKLVTFNLGGSFFCLSA